jgi:hypothetical protein
MREEWCLILVMLYFWSETALRDATISEAVSSFFAVAIF